MLCLPTELVHLVASFAAQESLPALAATCRALRGPARRHQVWRVEGMKGLFGFLALVLKFPTVRGEIRGLEFDPREKVVKIEAAEEGGATAPVAGTPLASTEGGLSSGSEGVASPPATSARASTPPASGATSPPNTMAAMPTATATAAAPAAPPPAPINEFAFQLLSLCLAQLPELRHLSLTLLPASLPAQLELVRAISNLDSLDTLLLSETRHLLSGAFLCWPAWVALLEALEGTGLARLSAPVELLPQDGTGTNLPPLPSVRIHSLRLQLRAFTDAHLDRLSSALYSHAALIVVQLTGPSPFLSTPAVAAAHSPARLSPALKLLGLPIDASSPRLGAAPFLAHAGRQSVVARGKHMLFTVVGERRQVGEMVRGLVGEGTRGKGWVEEMWVEGEGLGKEAREAVEGELVGRGVELRWVK